MTRHSLRWDALIFGVLFALCIVVWAALSVDAVSVHGLLIAGPITLIIAGVAGIALTLRRNS